MRSASAENLRRAARPHRAGGFLLVWALSLALFAGLLTGCDSEVDIDPPKAATDSSSDHPELAQDALDRFVTAVSDGSRDDAVDLATPDSRELLGWVHDNAAALEVGDLAMRYVDDGPALDPAEREALGQGAWRGTVQLTYGYTGFDEQPARLETSVVLVPGSGRARIASFGGAGDRSPLWLVDRLTVVRTGSSLVAVAGDSAGRYPGLVSRALRQVRLVLADWDGPLLVEVPRSLAQLDAVLQSAPGQYDNIAGVTTTADGSLAPDAPVRVFVNPTVFGKLKQRGAQVVMSHEATHVATGATFASMPTWLLEGFADYVALAHAGVPVSVAAGQILPQIRKKGLPRDLPSSEDLDPRATGLGATYEEAWLACRFLAQEYGADRLVRFYRTVSGGADTPTSFRTELGTTQRAFVAKWRADLARLAGVAP